MIGTTTERLLLFLLMFSIIAYAKPKTTVKVRVEEVINVRPNNAGDLSSSVGSVAGYVSYLNVTVLPDNPTDKLVNDGKWCLKNIPSDRTIQLVEGGTFVASLDGSYLSLEIPQPKGKPLQVDYKVYDHKWRTRQDIR